MDHYYHYHYYLIIVKTVVSLLMVPWLEHDLQSTDISLSSFTKRLKAVTRDIARLLPPQILALCCLHM